MQCMGGFSFQSSEQRSRFFKRQGMIFQQIGDIDDVIQRYPEIMRDK